MPKEDYNKVKKISPTTQNDSGTTQDKAQPVLVRGEEEVRDGFEDGDYSSNPSWDFPTSLSFFTVQQSTVKNGTYSVEVDASGASSDETQVMEYDRGSSPPSIQQSRYSMWAKQLQDPDARPTRFRLNPNSGDDTSSSYIEIEIDYAAVVGNATYTLTTYNSSGSIGSDNVVVDGGSWNRLELRLTDTQAELVVYDSNNNEVGSTSLINFDYLTDYRYTQIVGEQVSADYSIAFLDDISYEPELYEGTEGTGDIVVDFTNITGPEDIAVYDQNGNLLDYEIEDLDTTAETATLWAYNSWTRDDTVQAQIAYGSNSANEDRSMAGTGSNPWDKEQNALMVQHLNSDATDSTSNNNDGTINGATSVSNGQIGGAYDLDGTDDYINYPHNQQLEIDTNETVTWSIWFNSDTVSSNERIFSKYREFTVIPDRLGAQNINWATFGDSIDVVDAGDYTSGEWHHLVVEWDTANNTINSWYDGTQKLNGASYSNSPDNEGAPLQLGIFRGGIDNRDPYDGTLDEFKVFQGAESDEYWQAEYDASPKAGQVYFSQQAAEPTVQVTEDTVVKANAVSTTEISTETVSITETAIKASGVSTSLQADAINNVTDNADVATAVSTSITTIETADFLDKAVKATGISTSLTSTEIEVEVDTATRANALSTSLTTNEALPITDTAQKATATSTSVTSIEIINDVDTAVKASALVTTRESVETSSATDTAVKANGVSTSRTSIETIRILETAEKVEAVSTTLTSTETKTQVAPDVTPPLKVIEESMLKYIKEE